MKRKMHNGYISIIRYSLLVKIMGYTVNLGQPYEAIIDMLIRRGYAGNRTEAIRHALKAYERQLEDEETILLGRACESMMADIESGRMKTYSWDEVRERQNRKRGLK